MIITDFITEIKRLQEDPTPDDVVDYIFDEINELLLSGDFELVDTILSIVGLDASSYSLDALLSFLTITCTAVNLLPSRGQFFEVVKNEFIKREVSDIDIILH